MLCPGISDGLAGSLGLNLAFYKSSKLSAFGVLHRMLMELSYTHWLSLRAFFKVNALEYCFVLIKYSFCSLHKTFLAVLHASNSSKVRFKVKGYINGQVYAIKQIKGNIPHNCS